MKEHELRHHLYEKELQDLWFISINGEVQAEKQPLIMAFGVKKKHYDQNVFVRNINEPDTDDMWFELELEKKHHAPVKSFTVQRTHQKKRIKIPPHEELEKHHNKTVNEEAPNAEDAEQEKLHTPHTSNRTGMPNSVILEDDDDIDNITVYTASKWQSSQTNEPPQAYPTKSPLENSTNTSQNISSFALISLICGICVFPNLIAIACGHVAMRELKENPSLRGQLIARIGLTMGYVSLIALGLIFFKTRLLF